jgi:hypothetical protein
MKGLLIRSSGFGSATSSISFYHKTSALNHKRNSQRDNVSTLLIPHKKGNVNYAEITSSWV